MKKLIVYLTPDDADRIIADHNDRAALEAEVVAARQQLSSGADYPYWYDEARKLAAKVVDTEQALTAQRERADAAERFLHRQYASRPGAQTGETR